MSEGFAYLDILFFAMVAGFIALRLRSVLGRKTGEERRRGFGTSDSDKSSDNVVKMPERVPPPPPLDVDLVAESAVVGVRDIRANDRNFDPQGFLSGARAAFEMILGAFARGDRSVWVRKVYLHRFFGELREQRLLEHHTEQRKQFEDALAELRVGPPSPQGLARRIRELVADVRLDMAHEDKDLLNPELLRDDPINVSFTG